MSALLHLDDRAPQGVASDRDGDSDGPGGAGAAAGYWWAVSVHGLLDVRR